MGLISGLGPSLGCPTALLWPLCQLVTLEEPCLQAHRGDKVVARTGGLCGTSQSSSGHFTFKQPDFTCFSGCCRALAGPGCCSVGQEGAEDLALEGAVPDGCRHQAQHWPGPRGRRPSDFNGSQIHKIPWKEAAVVQGMTASPGAPFLGLLQARESVSTVLKIPWSSTVPFQG